MKYSVLMMVLVGFIEADVAPWPEPATDTTVVTGFSSEPNAHMTPTIRTETVPIVVGEIYIPKYTTNDPNMPIVITYQNYPDCAVITNNGTEQARCVITPMEEGELVLQIIITQRPNSCGGESVWFEELVIPVCNPTRNYSYGSFRLFAKTYMP